MPSTQSKAGRAAVAGIAALALVAVVGAVALGAGRAPSSAPTPSLSPTPVPAPSSPITPATPAPTSDPSDGPVVVVLDTTDDNDPRVAIDDQTGTLADVKAGHAGDGMSTRWNTAIVDQVDPKTIRVTWVGFPGDELANLTIVAKDGSVVLQFDQNAPPANSDALGADRVLILTFDDAVSADDVKVTFPPLEPAY